MGSSNFQQWNPGQSNQETDAQYTADSLRSGGAQTDDIFPSATANKGFYQWSTFIAALAQALANKGFTVLDTSYATLVSVLTNILTTADVKGLGYYVPFSTAPVFDCSKYNNFQMTLSGNLTSLTIANATAFQEITIAFTQNGTGGFSVPWPSNVESPGAVGGTPNATYTQSFIVLADNNLHPKGPMTVS
jgi:hypothetical protein